MFLSLQNSYVKILAPNLMLLGGGAFERWLAQESGTLTNGICTLIKEAPEISLSPSAMAEQSFDYESGRELSLQHDDANVLILDFPVSGTEK